MDALKIALLPIKERRKEMNLTLEQMRLIEKDEEDILIHHFEEMIHYSYAVNQSANRMFIGLVGKTYEMLRRIENQIRVELTKFLKKYFKHNSDYTKLNAMILEYMTDDPVDIGLGMGIDKPYSYNYCLMVNDAVENKCPCCDYGQMFDDRLDF